MLLQKFIARGTSQGQFRFAASKTGLNKYRSSSTFIKNELLSFKDDKHVLFMSPMYPSLTRKGPTTFSLNSQRIVLYLKFIFQPQNQVKVVILQKPITISSKEAQSFSLKYAHLASLLTVQPGSGSSVVITRTKTEDKRKVFYSLQLIDRPIESKVSLILRRSAGESEEQVQNSIPKLVFTFETWQYRMAHILLQRSLYDLSGLHLINEINRMQELNQMTDDNGISNSPKQLMKESSQFYDS